MGRSKPFYQKETWSMIRPFYAKFKKHYCQKCGELLSITWVTHYGIKKGSKEAKYRYFMFDIFNHPIDYTFAVFECPLCGNRLSINDQYYLGNPQKLKKDIDYYKRDAYHIYLDSLKEKSE